MSETFRGSGADHLIELLPRTTHTGQVCYSDPLELLLLTAVLKIGSISFLFQADADVQASAAAKKQLRLSYEEYRKIANMVVHYLRKNESDDLTKTKVCNLSHNQSTGLFGYFQKI